MNILFLSICLFYIATILTGVYHLRNNNKKIVPIKPNRNNIYSPVDVVLFKFYLKLDMLLINIGIDTVSLSSK